jgi:hypothetical protein
LLDVDVLRTFIGGWSRDFTESGRVVRPIAQGIISEVVASGGVVVVPQLFFEVDDFLGFARKAQDAGGEVLHVVLDVPAAECWRRLQARPSDYSEREVGQESLAAVVGAVLEQAGGEAYVERLAVDLLAFREREVPTHVVPCENTQLALEQLNALLAAHGRACG